MSEREAQALAQVIAILEGPGQDQRRWRAAVYDATERLRALSVRLTPEGEPHPEPENFDDIRRNAELDALWTNPQPETPEGERLWRLFQIGRLGVRPSAAAIRDFGQRVCQIEHEAATPGPNRYPLGIWRGTCGHVWDRRDEDTETCPRCAGEPRAGELDAAWAKAEAASSEAPDRTGPTWAEAREAAHANYAAGLRWPTG